MRNLTRFAMSMSAMTEKLKYEIAGTVSRMTEKLTPHKDSSPRPIFDRTSRTTLRR